MITVIIPAHLSPSFKSFDDRYDFEKECGHQLASIVAEYSDPEFGDRLHGSDATYMDGCPGPLCKQAHRQYGRQRTGGKPSAYWQVMEPVVEYIGSEVKKELDRRLKEMRAAFLEQVNLNVHLFPLVPTGKGRPEVYTSEMKEQ